MNNADCCNLGKTFAKYSSTKELLIYYFEMDENLKFMRASKVRDFCLRWTAGTVKMEDGYSEELLLPTTAVYYLLVSLISPQTVHYDI